VTIEEGTVVLPFTNRELMAVETISSQYCYERSAAQSHLCLTKQTKFTKEEKY